MSPQIAPAAHSLPPIKRIGLPARVMTARATLPTLPRIASMTIATVSATEVLNPQSKRPKPSTTLSC